MLKVVFIHLLTLSIAVSRIAATDQLKIDCEKVKKDIRTKMLANNEVQMYNMLIIDGGGIRGLIPGQVILYLEKYAYEYANKIGLTAVPEFNKCFQYKGHEKKMAMKDLFDTMAGTSTGSIISAGLSYPKDSAGFETNEWVPMYWGDDVIEIYSKKGDMIFKKNEGIKDAMKVVLTLIYLAVFAGIGYYFGRRWFDNPV